MRIGPPANRAFDAEGVQVVGHRDDVPALLAQCALTINPLAHIRGSAIKLVESLAAGRVCVTTVDGARGFAIGAPPGLVIVPDVAAMADADHRPARSSGAPPSRSKLPRPARWTAMRGNIAWRGFRLCLPSCSRA